MTLSDATERTAPTPDELTHRADWLTALRSGRYARAVDALRVGDGFCCLGVAEDVRGATWLAVEALDVDDVGYVGPGSHLLADEGQGTNLPEGNVLTQDGAAWLGLADVDPSVVVWRVPTDAELADDVLDGDGDLDPVVVVWMTSTLAELNDAGWSFAALADVVEDQGPTWRGRNDDAVHEANCRSVAGSPGRGYGDRS